MSTDLAVTQQYSMNDLERMAQAIAKSGLFGMKTPEQALALMILAQAEGRHPGSVAAEYHIIQGRPALKADAMLARFQMAGGKVEWLSYTDTRVAARFSHAQGGVLEVDWTLERAKTAGLGGKDNWKTYPRQMLRSRVISEGIRTLFPAVLSGVYTPEETVDMVPSPAPVLEAKIEPPPPAIETEVVEPASSIEYATPAQIAALSISLKEAGFGTSEPAKAQGREFLAHLAGLESLKSAKHLTMEQAASILDQVGNDDLGSFRADKSKLEVLVNDWQASRVAKEMGAA